MRILTIVFVLMGLAVDVTAANADVTCPSIFGDHMVLQRGKPVPVWGRADPGEAIVVRFAGQELRTKADEDGHWRVTLDELGVNDTGTLTVTGKNTLTFEDVLVGEVWICSGQSNMQWPVRLSKDADREIPEARFPKIRLITVKRLAAGTAQADFEGLWAPCTPQRAKDFSAVAYFFGREVHRLVEVPVGLINTSFGGTPAEAWTSRAGLEAEATLVPLLSRYDRQVREYDPALARAQYEVAMARWRQQGGKGRKRRPRLLPPPGERPHSCSTLFNAMVAPLVPYAVRGVIWYQGESNAGRAYQYRTLFPALIRDWRTQWNAELPFYFVQLANFRARDPQPGDSAWAELREAQLMTLRSLPRTGMAVAIDIGDARDIHPRNKQDVGRRLAAWALKHDYGLDIVPSGPLYASMEHKGGSIQLRFDHARGLAARGGGALEGFAVAGEDRRFVWAEARIEGPTVVVHSPSVASPVAVRYGWANNPACNLVNGVDLPAAPFRTDDWPAVTDPQNKLKRKAGK